MHRSFWLNQALRNNPRDADALSGTQTTDIAIIGGGYVGLWTALTLKELDGSVEVAVIDADICGGGASGRNGGFVMTWWPKIASLITLCGRDEAMHLVRASEAAIDQMDEFCQEHAPQAEFRRGGWLWTATSDAQMGAWNKVVSRANQLSPGTFHTPPPAEVARRSGSAQHLAGVFEPSNATVQPAELARALRRRALKIGVQIYEHSKVTRIRRGTTVTLETPCGALLLAKSVVVATNAWAASLRPLRNKLFVISSDMIMTEPIPERLEEIGWTGGEAITDSQTLVCYYRTTADGRIAFGKGGWSIGYGGRLPKAMHRDASRARMVIRDFRRYYPRLRDTSIDGDWAGPIDRTYNSLPIFGRLSGTPNIHYGVGWSGNGVGPSIVGGKILASLALERQDEWSQCGLVTTNARSFPPEPIRFIGGHVVREAIVRKERAEALELPPSKLAVAISKLAPAGLEDK